MKTIVAYTEEIDDLEAATEELFAQVSGFEFARNTMAILFTEEETDYPELYRLLSAKWKFPIMGTTAMAMLTGREGYCRGGISVMILTADDCCFSVGLTNELKREDYKEEITSLYTELEAQHDSPVKLCLCYYGIEVSNREVSSSSLLAALDGASHGLPIYGGTSSDNLTFSGYRVFCNDRVVQNGMVLALMSGEIYPRFVRVNSVENTATFSYEITRAEGNVVYRLGDSTFLEALKRENLRADQEEMMSAYILSPFVVTIDKGNGDRVETARIFSSLDLEKGAGTFHGVMPEGATLGIGLINREDVCRSVETAFRQMFRELAGQEHPCAALLCTSCSARYLALMNDPSVEGKAFLGHLPDGMSLMGFYAYGECCPVKGAKTGKEYNMFHNFTFTILAL